MKPQIPSKPPPETILSFGPIRFIPGRKGGRYPYCHSLVLEGEETWVVDPSSDRAYLRHLAQTRRVAAVFISHFHEDHQKYNHLFPQARFYVPGAEAAAFTSLKGIFDLMGIEDPLYLKYWGETLIREFHFRPLINLEPYYPGQTFVNGDLRLEIIPAPGHTPGHSAFYFPHQDVLFLADVDLTPFGPWYGDAASDLAAFEDTLARLADFPAATFLTAHEQGVFTWEEAQAGLAHFRRVIANRDNRLLEWLKTPHTAAELVHRRLIYGKVKEPSYIYDHIEARMLEKHLERLIRQGLVLLTTEGYLAK